MFGTIRTTGTLQTKKRRFLETLLIDHTVVALQETRGCEADLLLLPHAHRYYGSFSETTGPASSSSGGVAIAVCTDFVGRAEPVRTTIHSRGHALTLSLYILGWIHITSIHVDPTFSFAAKRRLLANIAEWHSGHDGVKIMLGDWNFLANDECRMSGDNNMGAFFDDRFPNFIELMQRDFTFCRLSREEGGSSVFSRIDRVYIEVHPTAMEDVTTTVTIRGAIDRRSAPSDHRAVCASLSIRAPGRRCVPPHAVLNERFDTILPNELAKYGAPSTPELAYEGIVQAAHAANAQIRLAPSVGAHPTAHQMVDVALRIFRLHRSERRRATVQVAEAFPATQEAVDNGTIDMQVIGRVLQESLDQCIALDVAEVERSSMPEFMKAAKKQKIRWRAEPYRPKRKRMILDGVYTRDGAPIDGDEAISQAIISEWAPVFEERQTDEAAMCFFESYIVPGCGATGWVWPRGELRTMAGRCTHSAPGPGGVPYAFWAQAPRDVLEFLEVTAEPMSQGIPPPAQLLDNLTICIPKGEYASDLERVIKRIHELRHITLMQTSAKLIAGVVNAELSDIAKRTIAREQRGFVEGRAIGDNIIEMEGALYEYSQLCDSMAAVVLLDFAQAFPNLAHKWMWCVLTVMGINAALLATIKALYGDLVTYVFHDGRKLHTFPIRAGIKQGCPLNGSLFAICANPLIRAHLANLTLHTRHRARIEAHWPVAAECPRPFCEVEARFWPRPEEFQVSHRSRRRGAPAIQGLCRGMCGGGGHASGHRGNAPRHCDRPGGPPHPMGQGEPQGDQADARHSGRPEPVGESCLL